MTSHSLKAKVNTQITASALPTLVPRKLSDLTSKGMTAPPPLQVPSAWFPFSPVFLTQTFPSSNTFPAHPRPPNICISVLLLRNKLPQTLQLQVTPITISQLPPRARPGLAGSWAQGLSRLQSRCCLSSLPLGSLGLSSESRMRSLEAGGLSPRVPAGCERDHCHLLEAAGRPAVALSQLLPQGQQEDLLR